MTSLLKYGQQESDSDDCCFEEQRQATTFRTLDEFQTPTRRSDASDAGTLPGARTTPASKASTFQTSPAFQDVSPAAPAARAGITSQASEVPPTPLESKAPLPQEEEVPKANEPPEESEEKVLKRPASKITSKASDSKEDGGSSAKAKAKAKSSAKPSKTPVKEDDGGKKEKAKNGGDDQGDEGVRPKAKAKASAKARDKGEEADEAAKNAKLATCPPKATSSQAKRSLPKSPSEGADAKGKKTRVAPTNQVAPESASAAAVHARQGALASDADLPKTLQQAIQQSAFWSCEYNLTSLNILMSLEGMDVLHGNSIWASVRRGQKSTTIKAAGGDSLTAPRISVMPGP